MVYLNKFFVNVLVCAFNKKEDLLGIRGLLRAL